MTEFCNEIDHTHHSPRGRYYAQLDLTPEFKASSGLDLDIQGELRSRHFRENRTAEAPHQGLRTWSGNDVL